MTCAKYAPVSFPSFGGAHLLISSLSVACLFRPVLVLPLAFCIKSQCKAIQPTKSFLKTAKPCSVVTAKGEARKLPGLWFRYDLDPPGGVFGPGGSQPSKLAIADIKRSIFSLAANIETFGR